MTKSFVVDAMFGKLARLLRIFGHDAIYAEDIETSAPDSKILEFAKKNDRLIITRDLPFHKIAPDHTIYLEGFDAYENLLELKEKLNLELDFNMPQARCSSCNSPIIKVKDINSIKNIVKPETFKYYDEFYQCSNPKCKKVYWKGSHVDKIIEKLNKITS